MIKAITLAAVALTFAAQAQAYCVHNELRDRELRIEQQEHPDPLRNDRRMKLTLAPGASKCCDFHQLDCNPGGRNNSVVQLAVSIAGDPVYECSVPPGSISNVKVTGAGTIRVQNNPKKQSANPYIIRIRTHDKDLTGPSGVPCAEPKLKGRK